MDIKTRENWERNLKKSKKKKKKEKRIKLMMKEDS